MKKKKQDYKENQIDREEQTILINITKMAQLIQKIKKNGKRANHM